jgi:very-short-patch-repair endonuclease
MRLLFHWLLIIVAMIVVLQIENMILRYALLGVLLLSLCVLVLMTLRRMLAASARSLWDRFRYSSEERAIRRRDAETESPLERALATALDKQGIAYVREYRISHTVVDFAFPRAKIAVECDGWRYHHDRVAEDAKRDAFLRSRGWTVLRFSGSRIRKDVDACVRDIAALL